MRLDDRFSSSKTTALNTQVQLLLAMISGWMNRKQQAVIEYLLEENRTLKQQFESTGKKLRLNNHQRRECLDHMIFFGEKPLRRAISQYMEHFHEERNHQGLDNVTPFPTSPPAQSESGLIVKSERLARRAPELLST